MPTTAHFRRVIAVVEFSPTIMAWASRPFLGVTAVVVTIATLAFTHVLWMPQWQGQSSVHGTESAQAYARQTKTNVRLTAVSSCHLTFNNTDDRNDIVHREFCDSAQVFASVLAIVRPWTMVDLQKLEWAYNLVRALDGTSPPDAPRTDGAVVECGVWKGGSTMTMMLAHLSSAKPWNRDFWLFDTFEGLPAPSSDKDDPAAKHLHDQLQGQSGVFRHGDSSLPGRWNYGPLELVQSILSQLQYPRSSVRFVKGKVEDTLRNPEQVLPERIAFLRLDTDWYDSTKAELEVLYPKVVPGGYVMIDDYCAWAGARRAANEFLEARGWVHLLQGVGTPLCAYFQVPAGR